MGHINVLFFDAKQGDLDYFRTEQEQYVHQRGADSWRNILTARSLREIQDLDLQKNAPNIGFFDAFTDGQYNAEAVAAARWIHQYTPRFALAPHLPALYLLVQDAGNIPAEVNQAKHDRTVRGILPKLNTPAKIVQTINELIMDVEFPHQFLHP